MENYTTSTTVRKDNLALALELAGRGWYVFPCRADKSPYTPHGFKDATTDPAQLRAWWERWPDALIGIYCERSGFFAIDFDRKGGRDGFESWAELVKTHGAGQDVICGMVQKTPTGGYHALFRLPEGVKIPNNANQLGPGLDLRSNGYICTGGAYQWQPGQDPMTGQLTDAPAWLLELIQRPEATPAPSRAAQAEKSPENSQETIDHWLEKALGRSYIGGRNDTGLWLALQLRDSHKVSLSEALAVEYPERCPQGSGAAYTRREWEATVKSAYSQAPRAPARSAAARNNGHFPGQELEGDPSQAAELPDQDNRFMLTESADHEGHARCVYHNYRGQFAYSDRLGWLAYTGKYYTRENAELQVERAIVRVLRERRLLAVEAELERLVKTTAGSRNNVVGTREQLKSIVAVNVDEFDANPDELNVNNGALNLKTGQLTPHNIKQRFTYCLPVDYDPQADPSAFLSFLAEAVNNDQEKIDYLQLLLGYTLTGYTWEEILLYLYGPTRSGKGTFTETLIKLMGGKPLATEVDFQTFSATREGDTQNFDLAPLKPCRFVAASESNKHLPLNPAKIKQLTGGNYVYCAYKHKEHFSYRPQYKIWLSSNHPVNVDVDDEAAWARVQVIEFPNSYLGHEDKRLKARLATPDNLRGLLRWIVEGAMKWYTLEGGLRPPQSIVKKTRTQRAEQDFIQQFLDELIDNDPEGWIHSGELHKIYRQWCDDNGVPPKMQNQFSQALVHKGYILARRRSDGKLIRVIHGLAVKQSVTRDTL